MLSMKKRKIINGGRLESLGIKAQLCNYTVASTYKSQKVRESEHLRSANTNAIPRIAHGGSAAHVLAHR